MENGIDQTLIPRKNGQNMVEFALILPILVLVVAGIFDLGRAFYASITLTNSAREGARYGILNPNDQVGMRATATQEAQSSGIILTSGDVIITCPDNVQPSGCDRGQALRITIHYIFDQMVLGFFFPHGIYIQRFAEMQVP